MAKVIVLFIGIVAFAAAPGATRAGQTDAPSAGETILFSALMCEGVQENAPVEPSVVFSVRNGNVYCWSLFDPVATKDIVYHVWYRRDKLVANVKLLLQPPRWATYSSIRLRDSDKGPWRVDIVNGGNKILKTLRFSISD